MYDCTGNIRDRFARITREYGPVIYLSANVTRICAGVHASLNGHDPDFPEAREIDMAATLREFEKTMRLLKRIDSRRYRF